MQIIRFHQVMENLRVGLFVVTDLARTLFWPSLKTNHQNTLQGPRKDTISIREEGDCSLWMATVISAKKQHLVSLRETSSLPRIVSTLRTRTICSSGNFKIATTSPR